MDSACIDRSMIGIGFRGVRVCTLFLVSKW